jgi:hypothetical protein
MKPLEYRAVSFDEAVEAIATPGRPAPRARPPHLARTEPRRDTLAESTCAWLDGLPAEVVPRELAHAFPRVANELCALWRRPSRCEVYLRELVLDHREGRDGFPPRVMQELGTLVAHYAELYPTRRSIWSHLSRR